MSSAATHRLQAPTNRRTRARAAALGADSPVTTVAHAWRCYLALAISMFLNMILAIANANGLGMNNKLVTAIQIVVTLASCAVILGQPIKLRPAEQYGLFAIVLLLIMTSALNGFNPKAVYDCLIIPLYIALGRSARAVKPRWMDWLLAAVTLVVLMEMVAPALFTRIVNPGAFFMATRSWIAAASGAAADSGLYIGATRGGGSVFSLADHRVSGPFLEPLSLGYFSVVMTIYYAAIHQSKLWVRLGAIAVCLFLSLVSDSRAASGLIILSSLILVYRVQLPAILIWLAPLAILAVALIIHWIQPAFLAGGDALYRIGLTFDGMAGFSVGDLIIGKVNTDRVGDSGILYLVNCLGIVGLLLALFYFAGLFSRRPDSASSVYVMMAVYITTMLIFGGAVFSIKTASLTGFVLGLATWPHAVPKSGEKRLRRLRNARA
ncbi:MULTISPECIES: hypothetical protein [unclassified Novosphingobium]|uniref:hypothetical protein n=1 Tax=unclassified Novosphingobium TaxID=2644732 RepID=UPI001469CF9E|nr:MULTISPECIES: hypothetical protein [unclassified Novosphingobium]NMN07049.1 hypothetical protein [Novosphingobium sp. SG919]NMN89363.1 hypothetical protein [Novosphingobium sp. SG916]